MTDQDELFVPDPQIDVIERRRSSCVLEDHSREYEGCPDLKAKSFPTFTIWVYSGAESRSGLVRLDQARWVWRISQAIDIMEWLCTY